MNPYESPLVESGPPSPWTPSLVLTVVSLTIASYVLGAVAIVCLNIVFSPQPYDWYLRFACALPAGLACALFSLVCHVLAQCFMPERTSEQE